MVWMESSNVENFDKSLAEGVMLLTPFSATGDDEATVKFVKAYGDANNGETPNQFAADTYDVLYAMQAAANDAGITPDMSNEDISAAMSASMLNITLDGLTGEAKWTEDGECDKAPTGLCDQRWRLRFYGVIIRIEPLCRSYGRGFNHFPDCAGDGR